jgi:hypothetical protein
MVPDGSAKKQFYLAVVKCDHVLLLNSALTSNDDVKAIHQLLIDTMNTLKSSDKPVFTESCRYGSKRKLNSISRDSVEERSCNAGDRV